jgi:hypothetical protein
MIQDVLSAMPPGRVLLSRRNTWARRNSRERRIGRLEYVPETEALDRAKAVWNLGRIIAIHLRDGTKWECGPHSRWPL